MSMSKPLVYSAVSLSVITCLCLALPPQNPDSRVLVKPGTGNEENGKREMGKYGISDSRGGGRGLV